MSWATAPRMVPLTAAGIPAEDRARLRGRLAVADRYLSGADDAPPLPGILGLLGHHPRLAANWLALSGDLLDDPVLDPRVRELLVLRVGWQTRCRYEWEQHTRMAIAAGLTAVEISAITHGADADSWSEPDRVLLRAVDQMIDGHRIDDDTWRALADRFDEQELLELLFVIGSYLCLAVVLNSVDLQPDPGASDDEIQPTGTERWR